MVSNLPNYISITKDISKDLYISISKLNPDKIVVLVDENTKAHCLSLTQLDKHETIEIKSGERHKTLNTCSFIWEQLTEIGCSRKSLLINLGGGVIGDMGGFCASTFKRGMSFINVPTTLLSQVDASIGGKLGIDFNGLKNHIGLFREPDKVIISTQFLNTLPENELKSGYAEVVKHSLIFDSHHWDHLQETPFDKLDWDMIIRKSVQIKNTVVDKDPLEKGLRKILNFGHSIGHAIESFLLDKEGALLHGEAVAIGMMLESHISLQKSLIPQSDYRRIKKFIFETFKLPKTLPSLDKLIPYLAQDKKNDAGNMSFALLLEIGKCDYDINVTSDEINNALINYSS